MRTAIIHYWLVTMRGGEKVLESLCRLFPDADIYTHVVDPERLSPFLREHTLHTTFINSLPFARRHYQKYLPLMPLALEQLDLRGYDLVISSESGPAKGVLTDSGTTHICYCHTPMRYLWDAYHDYLGRCGFVSRQIFRLAAHRLRQWDVASAARVDHFMANSANVAQRIHKHYRREAIVLHPPVDVEGFRPQTFARPDTHAPYILIGQLVGYKAANIAVEAFTRSGRELLIVGEGEERTRLEHMASPNIRFAGRQGDEELKAMLHSARALIFPGEEDFGIVPVEAMAAGKAVIAYGRGGALETVRDGLSGLFFHEQTPEALNAVVDAYEQREDSFVPEAIHASVANFATAIFEQRFRDYLDGVLRPDR